MIRRQGNKWVVDSSWPDGLRTRFRRPTKEKASELDLRIRLAILDGTWSVMRAEFQMPGNTTGLVSRRFTDIADLYFKEYVQSYNRSFKCKRSFLNRFKKHFGHLPFRSVTLRHGDHYIAWRKASGLANASINREVATLRHMFEWAIDRGFCDRNPLARLKKLDEQEWAGPRPTDEIVEAVLARLDPRFLPIYVLIRETGARRGEVLGLERWQIDRANRVVLFAKRTKNGKSWQAPLTERALAAIDSIPEMRGCPYLFYNPETGKPWHDARKPWEAARKAAGYPWLRVRDLRPAYGIKLSEAGVPMHFIREVMGHGSTAVTEKYYARFRPESARKVVLEVLEGGRRASA